jgi:hypothetical protein
MSFAVTFKPEVPQMVVIEPAPVIELHLALLGFISQHVDASLASHVAPAHLVLLAIPGGVPIKAPVYASPVQRVPAFAVLQ